MKNRRYGCIALMLVLILAFCGCSAKSESMDMMTEGSAPEEFNKSEAMDFGLEYEYEAPMEEYESVEEEGTAQAETVTETNRKLIKSQYITTETKEFDAFAAMIKEKTESLGGYIEQSNVSGNSYYSSNRRSASYTVRIPVENLETFVNGIQKQSNVTNYSEQVEDITLQYVDTESRIKALKIEQESLMKMLEEEGDLDTILRIQSRLTEVRYELQSYESQMRTFDNKIEYSTVHLDVYEVERATSKDEGGFGTRLMERLSDSFYGLGVGLENFALFLLGGIPYWILLGCIVGAVVLVVKNIKKRKTVKQVLKETNLNQAYEEIEPVIQGKTEDVQEK